MAQRFSAPLALVYKGNDMRAIYKVEAGNRTAKVYRDSDWNEYRVKYWVDDRLLLDADYHTEDKADAISNADYFVSSQIIPERFQIEEYKDFWVVYDKQTDLYVDRECNPYPAGFLTKAEAVATARYLNSL